jgi:hypothetical protein
MGTSGAYGGSPGWNKVRNQTREWLDSGGGGGGEAPPTPVPPTPPPDVSEGRPPAVRPTISPALAGLITGLGGLLAGGRGNGGGSGGGGGGGPAGGGRSSGRASTVGGRALGGAYGARTGAAGPLAELGLDLAELSGLTRYEQAQRILDAAIGPRGDVLDSELRKTNASVVLWALTEEVEPTPVELADRWVVEYVWEMWITESGSILQDHPADGYDRVRAEQEMRAALEATVSANAMPDDRPLTTADFTAAIEGALASLRRMSGNAA